MSKSHFNVLLPLDINAIFKNLANTVILGLLHLYKNMEVVCDQLLNIYVAQSPKNIYCHKKWRIEFIISQQSNKNEA